MDFENYLADMVHSILEWWKEHQFDTKGPRGKYDVYHDEPLFVKIAKEIQEFYDCKYTIGSITKELTDEEKQEENELYLKMCAEKGIKNPLPLRLSDGTYNEYALIALG